MFAWLKGPGKVFRQPLPGGTNYLSAYDKEGNLLRASRADQQNRNYDDPELDEDEDTLQARELESG